MPLRGIRAVTTAVSSTPASTIRPDRSRRGCAVEGYDCSRSSVSGTALRTRCGKLLVALDDDERHASSQFGNGPGSAAYPPCGGWMRLGCATSSRMRSASPPLHSPTTAIVDFPGVCRALAAHYRSRRHRTTVRGGDGLQRRHGRVVVQTDAEDGGRPGRRVCRLVRRPCCAARRGRRRAAHRALPRRVLPAGPPACAPGSRTHLSRPRSAVSVPRRPPHPTRRRACGRRSERRNPRREGYRRGWITPSEVVEVLASPGFRAFARKHWRTGWPSSADRCRSECSSNGPSATSQSCARRTSSLPRRGSVPRPWTPTDLSSTNFRIPRLGPVLAVLRLLLPRRSSSRSPSTSATR